jgi:hypothetical protein
VTEEERAMIKDMHRAMFDPDPATGRSWFQRSDDMLKTYERCGWAIRWSYRLILALAALGAALQALFHFRLRGGGE